MKNKFKIGDIVKVPKFGWTCPRLEIIKIDDVSISLKLIDSYLHYKPGETFNSLNLEWYFDNLILSTVNKIPEYLK